MKHRSVMIIYPLSVVAFAVMRFYELFFAIDSQNGFYKFDYSFMSTVAIVFVLAVVGIIVYFSAVDLNKEPKSDIGTVTKVLSVVFAATLAYSFFAGVLTANGFMEILCSLLTGVAAICYAVFGIEAIIGKKIDKIVTVGFVPVWLFMLLEVFIKNNDVASAPERVYDILMIGFCILASLGIAEDIAGETGKSGKLMFASCLIAGAFCTASTLPRYIISLFFGADRLHSYATDDLFFLAFGIFAVLYAFDRYKNKKIN